RKVLSMAPASNYTVRAMARLGDCAYELKKYDEAAALYRRAASAATDEVTDETEVAAGVRADYMVGQAYLVAKNYTTCFGAFRKFIDRHPGHPLVNMAYQSIGDGHLGLEQYQQALSAYRMVGTVAKERTAAMRRVTPGGRLYLRVTDADVNVGETPRTVRAIVRTSGGDEETVELEPMGLRNPVFLGTIPTALSDPRKSGDLEKVFTEAQAAEVRQALSDARAKVKAAQDKRQEAAEVERSAEKITNPAGAEKKRAALVAEAEALEGTAKAGMTAACARVDAAIGALEKIVEAWAPEQSVKALAKTAAAVKPTTAPVAPVTPGGEGDPGVRAALAGTLPTPDDEPGKDSAGGPPGVPVTPTGLSESDVDKVRLEAIGKPTGPETVDARLTAVSVWARLLKRQFQRLELTGNDKIEVEYVDEVGPKGPQKVIRKDSLTVAADAAIGLYTRDGSERVVQVVLGGDVLLRVEDLDRDLTGGADTVTATLAALPKVDTRASDLREETRPATQPTTQRSTPGEMSAEEAAAAASAAKVLPLAPEGMPSITVELKETGPHTGVFEAVVKTTATGLAHAGKTLALTPGAQLRMAYKDPAAVRNADGWVLALAAECLQDAGGEALAVQFGQTYLDLQAKLKRAAAAGEMGKIYLELGLVKRGKEYLRSAQTDCNEVARAAARTPLGEEALHHSWQIYFYAGLLDEAAQAARALVSAYPQSDYVPDALLAIGQVSLQQGERQVEQDKASGQKTAMNRDLQRAVSQFEELVRRYPRGGRAPEALFMVGKAKQLAGQTGLDTFERLAKQFPDSAFAARGLAQVGEYYLGIGDFGRAQDYFGRILIDYPDSPDLGAVTLSRGVCQWKTGQIADALASLYKVAEEHPGTKLAADARRHINSINQARGAGGAAAPAAPAPASGAAAPVMKKD
ncbi:MAG TPA: tetratricopeptide repeat protein, partial [Tepidisphaeraceae bacterium]|nr:tetratricopeptide repeat protein [Tepidisphaeraceae bacterium]